MLQQITAEVRQTGKAWRKGCVGENIQFFAHYNGLSFYYCARNNVTYFAQEVRDAQLLAKRHK